MDNNKSQIIYSVVIPVFNEEGSLPTLFNQLLQVLPALNANYEIIFVDDGSTDNSYRLLIELQNKYSLFVRVMKMESRGGQTKALKAGIDNANGDFIITMDSDLQNDPSDIPFLLAKMNEGYDCVCGWRKLRRDSFLKTILSKTANGFQRLLTGVSAHDISCTLRAYKSNWARRVPLNWEGQHRFIPLCLALQGARVGEIVSNHRARSYGCSKYGHMRAFKVGIDFLRVLTSKGR